MLASETPSAAPPATSTVRLSIRTPIALTGAQLSWPVDLAEGVGQAELARIEDAVRVERALQRNQNVERGAECVTDEPAAVEADTVVVAEHDMGGGVPCGPVEGVAPGGPLVIGRASGKCEVEARAIAVRVGLMSRH